MSMAAESSSLPAFPASDATERHLPEAAVRFALAFFVAGFFISFYSDSPLGLMTVKLSDWLLPLFLPALFFTGRGKASILASVRGTGSGWHIGLAIIGAVFLIAFFRGIVFRNGQVDLLTVKKLLALWIGFFYFFVGLLISSRRLGGTAVRFFVAAGVASATYGLIRHWLAFIGVAEAPWYPRATAFFEGPNVMGITLAMALVFLFAHKHENHRRTAASPDIAMAALLFLGFILAGSRSALLGLVLGIGYLLQQGIGRKKILAAMIFAALAYALLYGIPYIAFQNAPERSAALLAEKPAFKTAPVPYLFGRSLVDPAEARVQIAEQQISLWKENPLVGIGLGSFVFATRGRLDNHGTYLWLLTEFGLLGTIAIAFALGIFLRIYRRMTLDSDEGRWQGHAAIGMFLVAVGAAAGTTIFFERMFWLFAGVLVTAAKDGARHIRSVAAVR